MKKQFLDSGKIVGTHGIKGEVRIEPWADSPAFLCAFKTLYLDERGETAIRVKSRPHKNITLCKIEGVDTIEAAERLRGKIVYINRDDVRLDEGVHFVQDLIGSEGRGIRHRGALEVQVRRVEQGGDRPEARVDLEADRHRKRRGAHHAHERDL